MIEVEQIKKLKARYFRFVDLKLRDEWQALWTDDGVFEVEGEPQPRRGPVEIVARSPLLNDPSAISVHHGHTPEIELTGPDTATGIWAMADYIVFPSRNGNRVRIWGYGHYQEKYRKVDGSWRIAHSRLSRIQVDRVDEPLKAQGSNSGDVNT